MASGSRVFTLKRIGGAAETAPLEGPAGPAIIAVAHRKAAPEPEAAPATHVTAADIAGRYAVMREKHDTGCMLTLDDKTRGKVGGDRAQLAPGCRDQGIVIFDPVGWRLVKGELGPDRPRRPHRQARCRRRRQMGEGHHGRQQAAGAQEALALARYAAFASWRST